jgi:cytochrome P450
MSGVATATANASTSNGAGPPGPPLPRAVQTAFWFRGAQRVLRTCHARYGDTFQLRIAYEDTWVFVTDPDDVKRVFTGDPALLHAGEANRILLPVLGPRSLLLLDEDAHMEHRKLLLPPFHGARMKRYGELMSDIAAAEI